MHYQRCRQHRLLLFVLMLSLLTLPRVRLCRASAEEKPVLQLHQIAIGCADAYLLLVDDVAIMIDGGNDAEKSPDTLMAYLHAAGLDHLTAYFVTHYHDDHAGNLRLLMKTFGTEETIVYGPSDRLPEAYGPLPIGRYRRLKDNDALDIGPLRIRCVGAAAGFA